MVKSDDVIKSKLKEYLSIKEPFKVRVHIGTGSEKFDQLLWEEGGQTFHLENITYGANDFSIYKEEDWISGRGTKCSEKPYIVIEATDALNRGSSGDAQAQRLHHLYPTVRMGIISIYYLEPGVHDFYGQMMGAAYNFSEAQRKETGNQISALIITKKISDIQKIVDNLLNQTKLEEIIRELLKRMKMYYEHYFQSKYKSNWNLFFEKTQFGLTKDNDGYFISAIRPPHPETDTPPWSDSHHRAASLPFMGYNLLLGFRSFSPNRNKFYFVLPLFRKRILIELNKRKTSDKEWKIFSGISHNWDIVTLDEIYGLKQSDYEISEDIWKHNLNRNPHKKMWKDFIDRIKQGLKNGELSIELDNNKFG